MFENVSPSSLVSVANLHCVFFFFGLVVIKLLTNIRSNTNTIERSQYSTVIVDYSIRMLSSKMIRIFVYVAFIGNTWTTNSADRLSASNDSKPAGTLERLSPGERSFSSHETHFVYRSRPYGPPCGSSTKKSAVGPPTPSKGYNKPSPSPPCQPKKHSPIHSIKTKSCGCKEAVPPEAGKDPHRCLSLCSYGNGCDGSCGHPGLLMKTQSSNHQAHLCNWRVGKSRCRHVDLPDLPWDGEDEAEAPKQPKAPHAGFKSLAHLADRVKSVTHDKT